MLFQVGPLTLDTFPASIDAMERDGEADYAKHALLNRRKGYEFEGPGDDTLTLSGEVLPFHIGGLGAIELAHQLRDTGDPVYVMRGDGAVIGWHVIMAVRERHGGGKAPIAPNGVGFVVTYEIRMERCGDPGPSAGAGLIASLLSLFG